jgi:TPR repeat protein
LACDGGVLVACHTLALFYYEGKGVTQDRAKAAQLFEQACDDASRLACVQAGELYEHGYGVVKDKCCFSRYSDMEFHDFPSRSGIEISECRV